MNILVIDDELNIRKTIAYCLEGAGHRVAAVGNARDARDVTQRQGFDLAFLDLRLGTDDGLDLIPELLNNAPGIQVAVITAYATISTAVEAMRRGAVDYLPKPFTPEQILLMVQRAETVCRLQRQVEGLRADLARTEPAAHLHSRHPEMVRAIHLARQVAPTPSTVLLLGASGTGKGVLARSIHNWGDRWDKPFGVVSCPSLSHDLLESELFGHIRGAFTHAVRDAPGRIAACEGGTLFLDEIADLPLAVQPKLLRFLQDREYERVGESHTRHADVRIIAATNADLERAVREGRFREDLYFRLAVFEIRMPSLAERPDDVEALAAALLPFFAAQCHKNLQGFTDAALRALREHAWPGNVRELRNALERAAILCTSDRIDLPDLPPSLTPQNNPVMLGDPVSLEAVEERHIRLVLGNTRTFQDAAEILGVDQATLWRKRRQYSI
ncbi:Two-component response regulator AlgB [Magnetococcus marinus MC-1]|uniref:Two-component response regulator AlgB n=1 Tax=Magnetococcus marinus (strain ATCC BAA-1437 / JCM 17883 / MC-1) TaxID=156889 RepID=A0LDP2_MAGMM|nr:sigma-54 dependent transcriptional regulator [Magnetococcus marinus]ABK46085.1 Two-component response regulator AlgB [Magnetococcus marinus MC-1]